MEAAKVPGGEIRRLHIIYFLSRSGCRIEHPHLIRVHHLARNGVYLRDIKRWLGELRGKELPEAFAWSYKRRYKAGYVWQDLLDDDLITPISDNEYVLKGSQISPTLLETGSLGAVDKKASIPRQQQCLKEEPKIQTYPQSATDTPSKVSSEISQESDRSTLTDEYDCSKFEQNPDEQSSERLTENYTLPPLYQHLLNRKSRKQRTEDEIVNNNKTDAPDDSSFSTSSSSSSSSKFSFDKCRSNSTRGSFVFRNLITCGNADVSDAVLVMLNKKGSNKPNNGELSSEICKRDKLGGSATGFANSWSHQKHQQYGASRRSYDGGETNKNKKKPGEFMTQNHPKPFGGPTCSQCGKKFRPEKMHKHMKSCRGMKSLSKSAEKTAPPRSSTSSNTDSTSFLPIKI
ncbi:protein UPSTREAM OF FLC-like isoform X1 [Neltuma alba]|uniref:protein UPSTREAM OF FLC-like isoform X1 n=1 Tax=Neltuma alba TaxID=207710 RepID=UPI0010A34BD5|nr:protein UPSTREAM OF FLC-like isoform X1 [Prosopis alba]XP_028799767.1 protein UPSTREAM OF FLC-like isoform X1 [Prosopis alba]XP_028799768.1 protein UPSTREAM OF FLC-like isoform X1 [Prosopis alba]XP_028799769.1 protein UPSTREAM OF FLC-like isoform X1 [Prosopis alba]